MINLGLAKDRGLSEETIKLIEALHAKRDKFYKYIEISEYPPEMHYWDSRLNSIEHNLQKLWGFVVDSNYIKFWDRPKCSCPKIDNNDRYPHGPYVYDEKCVLHGALR